MSVGLTTVLVLGAISWLFKSAGPLILGGDRTLPPIVERLALLLPIPLLAAMTATSTVIDDRTWTLDARIVGVVAAGLALWRRLPFVVVVIIAAAATAGARALAG